MKTIFCCILIGIFLPVVSGALPDDFSDRYASIAGNDRERLHALFTVWWEERLALNPETATMLGEEKWNDRWSDLSTETIARQKKNLERPVQSLSKIDRQKLSPEDQLSFDLFQRTVKLDLEGARFPTELLPLTHMSGVHRTMVETLRLMPTRSEKDYENVLL